jgi:hypothetical protein
MPLKTLYWQQPQSHLVNSWEFQFQRVGSEEWEWVIRVEPVDDCLECFQAVVELPETALLVRSRAVGAQGPTGWSNHLPVYLPEFEFGVGLAACILALIWRSGKKKCRRWFWFRET